MQLSEMERELPLEDVKMNSSRTIGWVDAVNRLWSRKRRVALWAIVCLLTSTLFVLRNCKYDATVSLMPPDSGSGGLSGLLPAISKVSGLSGGGGSGLAGMAGDMIGIKSSGALFTKVLQSRTVEDAMVDKFDLQRRFSFNGNLWRKRKIDAREELRKKTTIEEDKKSGVISLTVRDGDPGRARDMANEYVRQLNKVMTSVMNTAAGREKEFIAKRLVEESGLLQKAEKDLSEFSSGSMAFDPTQQMRATVESAARLEGALIEARAELQAAEQVYAPENIRVKSARAKIGQLDQELKKINGGRPAKAGSQDSFPYPSAKDLPALGVKWTDLYRESKIHETVFEMLTQQYEMARIQEAKETPTAKVLDDAVLPEKTTPRPSMVLLIGTITGVILGCCGVLLQDRLQALDPADPRKVLLSNMYFGMQNKANSIWNAVRFRRVIGHDQK